MNKHLIYALSDPRPGERGAVRYVGKSCTGMARPRQHFQPKRLASDDTYKARWIRSVLVDGYRPTIEVVEEFGTAEQLAEAEQFWICQFRALGFKLTNLTDGGDGGWGRPCTLQTRAKRAASMLGFRHSEETKRKLSGRPVNERQRAAVAESNRRRKGWKHTPEALAKISVAHKGKRIDDEHRVASSRVQGGRPVVDENGNVYQTRGEAALKLGLWTQNIRLVLRGRMKTTGGHSFRYLD